MVVGSDAEDDVSSVDDVTVDVWLSGHGLVSSGRGSGSQPSPGQM